jgi:hypothetical protein
VRCAALALVLTACGAGHARSSSADLVNIAPVRGPAGIAVSGVATAVTPSEPPVELAVRGSHLCVRADGRVYCVTSSGSANQPLIQPRNVVAGIEDAERLALGGTFDCVVTRRGTVQCFGGNTDGELGAKLSAEWSDVPVDVVGVAHARRIFAGASHACASLEDQQLLCWGRNDRGQTGSDTYYRSEARALVSATVVPGVKSDGLALTLGATCARLAAGAVSCWGDHLRPTVVPDIAGVDEIAGSDTALCATRRGEVVCWSGAGALLRPAELRRDGSPSAVPHLQGVAAGTVHSPSTPARGPTKHGPVLHRSTGEDTSGWGRERESERLALAVTRSSRSELPCQRGPPRSLRGRSPSSCAP